MLLDKPLKLCSGAGNGVDQACLMTATNMLIGQPKLGDRATCVCTLLREFIIPTNDAMPNGMRQKHYGLLPWEIIGTKIGCTEKDWQIRFARAKFLVGQLSLVTKLMDACTLKPEDVLTYHNAPEPLVKMLRAYSETAKYAREGLGYLATYIGETGMYSNTYPEKANRIASYVGQAFRYAIDYVEVANSYKEFAIQARAGILGKQLMLASFVAAHIWATGDFFDRMAIDTFAKEYEVADRVAKERAKFEGREFRDVLDELCALCAETIRSVAKIGDKTPTECVVTPQELAAKLNA